MESVLRDLRIAARGLRRNLGFTAVAITTLALGIGATTTVFSVVYGVLLRPLPFPNADRLVQIVQTLETDSPDEEGHRAGLSTDQFANLQDYATTLESVGVLLGHASRTLTGIATPVRLNGAQVTAGLLTGLGVQPLVGRLFQHEDAEAGADPVVVLSEGTWRRYFGGDPGIINRRITLGDVRTRVIGVMPAVFTFPSLADPGAGTNSAGDVDEVPEFWAPMQPFTRSAPGATGATILQSWALLQRGATLEQAEAEVQSLAGPILSGRPSRPIELVSAREEMGLPARRVLLIFQAGVTMILLIASVNVINLLLTRAAGRRHEWALRMALGASRARIVRERATEALWLAACGGTLGCGVAFVLTRALQLMPPHLLPRLREIQVDLVVLAFAIAVSLATGLVVGLLSALRIGWADPTHWLHHRTQGTTSRLQRTRPSNALVVLQVAATVVLLTASGLLVGSFIRLVRVDVGYDPRGVLTFEVGLPPGRYTTAEARNRFFETLSEALRGVPGIESVAAHGREGIGFDPLIIDGRPAGEANVWFRLVTPDYFRTLKLPVRQGRESRVDDSRAGASGIIVNEAFVRRYAAGNAVLGRPVQWGDRFGTRDIVAVVADSKQTFDAREQPTMYLPVESTTGIANLTMLVRTSSSTDPADAMSAAREAMRRIDPQLAAYNVTTLENRLAQQAAASRFVGWLSLACALVALLLAAIGLYGVLSYSVRARWNEFGIRIALGAHQRTVMRAVLEQGLVLTAAGLALGLTGSYLATQSLASLLFGVTPHDTSTFAGTAAVLTITAALACYVPARRATRVDPAVVLRSE